LGDFYGADLAAIHADGFGGLGAAAAGVVVAALGDSLSGARILDLGCGAGALAAPLTQAGAQVWGLDLSADLLAIARRRVPGADFVQGSLHDAELPEAQAVCAIGEVVNYLADPRAGDAALRRFLEKAARALPRDGLLLFDAAAPGRGSSRSFTEGPDWAVGSVNAEADGILTRRITTFTRDGGGWRRTEEVHQLALLPQEVVLGALAAAGFRSQVLAGYGDLVLPAGLPVYHALRN
jgi:SAM-dependent methyltransferase